MRKVLITRRLPNIAENILSNSFEVNQIKENKPLNREKLISAVQKYDAILSTVTEKFERTVLSKSNKLVSSAKLGRVKPIAVTTNNN